MLANHRKGIFRWKRAFLGASQRPVRLLSNQISNLKLETHYFLFTFVQLTAFHLRNYLLGRQALQSYNSNLREQQWKYSIWLIFERRLYPHLPPSNYAPGMQQTSNSSIEEIQDTKAIACKMNIIPIITCEINDHECVSNAMTLFCFNLGVSIISHFNF